MAAFLAWLHSTLAYRLGRDDALDVSQYVLVPLDSASLYKSAEKRVIVSRASSMEPLMRASLLVVFAVGILSCSGDSPAAIEGPP